MENKIEDLKDLCAAYEAALSYDYCPSVDEAVALVDEINTDFSVDNFRRGAEKNQGCQPSEIVRKMVCLIAEFD